MCALSDTYAHMDALSQFRHSPQQQKYAHVNHSTSNEFWSCVNMEDALIRETEREAW